VETFGFGAAAVVAALFAFAFAEIFAVCPLLLRTAVFAAAGFFVAGVAVV
jgi:hypothetical protein